MCSRPRPFRSTLPWLIFLLSLRRATHASIGTAGVPSEGLITLSMVFNSVGLPVEAIGLIMGIEPDPGYDKNSGKTLRQYAVCTAIVAKQDGALDRTKFDSVS